MTLKASQFETQDLEGTQTTFVGTVGTSLVAVPSVAGNKIQRFTVVSDFGNNVTSEIEVYLDGGTNAIGKVGPSGCLECDVRGTQTQIHLKANEAGVAYRVTLFRE